MLYQQQKITGDMSKWRRSNIVTIDNHYGQMPAINFNEIEQVIYPDGSTQANQVDVLRDDFSHASEEYPLLNPETDEVIGVTTDQQLAAILYSKYMYLVNKRDNPLTQTDEQNQDISA